MFVCKIEVFKRHCTQLLWMELCHRAACCCGRTVNGVVKTRKAQMELPCSVCVCVSLHR